MTKSILYVDDEPINTFLFSKMFGVSYDVITANSGQEGLDILMNNPDVKIVLSRRQGPYLRKIRFSTGRTLSHRQSGPDPQTSLRYIGGTGQRPEIKAQQDG